MLAGKIFTFGNDISHRDSSGTARTLYDRSTDTLGNSSTNVTARDSGRHEFSRSMAAKVVVGKCSPVADLVSHGPPACGWRHQLQCRRQSVRALLHWSHRQHKRKQFHSVNDLRTTYPSSFTKIAQLTNSLSFLTAALETLVMWRK